MVFARYSDFCYLIVWVCIPGLVNGTASATRAPCGQREPLATLVYLARSKLYRRARCEESNVLAQVAVCPFSVRSHPSLGWFVFFLSTQQHVVFTPSSEEKGRSRRQARSRQGETTEDPTLSRLSRSIPRDFPALGPRRGTGGATVPPRVVGGGGTSERAQGYRGRRRNGKHDGSPPGAASRRPRGAGFSRTTWPPGGDAPGAHVLL